MTAVHTVKSLPGPKSFYGLKNIRDMAQKGMLGFVADNWQEYGDLFEVQVGPKKLVMLIHPDHVRHVTLTNARNYDKLQSYDGVRKYVIGDGIVTSTGELWKRQRRLMAPFYTPRSVEEFSNIFIRDTVAMQSVGSAWPPTRSRWKCLTRWRSSQPLSSSKRSLARNQSKIFFRLKNLWKR